eukprot:CAMPEP_0171131428 /NCGR_PEP_ID=MMETSP0766_2-20121228/122690_1 /TAXON_ID=439317 /ORGANISM="Gambierdiscus australes, Strain CAWD 149" /LENGTH=222 /DNA_ID=CAMNT_0011594723 /DNA_START=140 /DNA_END=808 /DNA_ORIENTATION=+
MWYGLTTEELQARYEELEREQRCEVASQDVNLHFHSVQQWRQADYAPPHQGRSVLQGMDVQAQSATGVATSFRSSPLRTERASTARHLATTGAPLDANTSVSLSPRREARWIRGEQQGNRGSMKVLGAPPPQAQSFASPAQAHRTTRLSAMPAMAAVVAQQSMVRAQAGASPTRLARSSNDSVARRWTSSRPSLPAVAASSSRGAPPPAAGVALLAASRGRA